MPIPSSMRAVQLTAWQSEPELREVPVPRPGPGELLLRVDAAGLCHSDLHVMSCPPGTLPYDLPMTLGHEIAGTVVEVGDGVDGSWLDRLAVVHGVWSCGTCHSCRRGHENHCLHLDGRVGFGLGRPGGLAEYVLVPAARQLVAADGMVATELAPLADAALTAYHAIRLHREAIEGGTVVVIGAGGLGHLAVQILKQTTDAHIVVVDTRPAALEAAREHGAHTTGTTVAEAVDAPVDVVLDFVGADSTLAAGAEVLAPGGRLVMVGGGGGSMTVAKGRDLPLGWHVNAPFWGPRQDLEAVVELARGGQIVADIEVVRFSDTLDAYRRLREGDVRGRIVVVPD
ncbi:alcohol dehydrogenase catalytic domain-containing protein [Aeromicrobium sp. Root344]|uniref:alcohol dehydrogenase catalytic domain-containing protein n=1 Tax=Aeromicrobium sp. Root344 TaxID=1736521 RepID=UPI000AD6C89A|nr:alcohol dehydrogenase catalytic domain-containing protein [Aeromicrobium sp. Root344]